MRRLIVGLLVLAALFVAADRIAAYLASRQVASDAARATSQCRRPGVDIGGFPFLTQAIAGRYDDVTLTTSCKEAVVLRPVRIVLRGVHLGLGPIVHNNVDRVPVDRVDAAATIPFSTLDREVAGQRVTFGRGPGNTITVTGTLTVAGQSISAHGDGSVSISAGTLHVAVGTVHTPLGDVSSGGSLDLSLPLPTLPFHISGLAVRADSTGVVLFASAHDVVLRR